MNTRQFICFCLLAASPFTAYAFTPGSGGDNPETTPVTAPVAPDEDILRPYADALGTWFLQIDAGINYTFLSINGSTQNVPGAVVRSPLIFEGPTTLFNSANGLGLLAGISIGYDFPKVLGIRLRLDFDAKSAGKSGQAVDSCNVGAGNVPFRANKDYTLTHNYLTISLLPSVRFGGLYIFAGPCVGLPLSAKYTETNTSLDNCIYFPNIPADSSHVMTATADSLAPSVRFALKIGAGYNIPLTKKMFLVPQIAYDLGFTETAPNDAPAGFVSNKPGAIGSTYPFTINHRFTLSAVQATLGLRITL